MSQLDELSHAKLLGIAVDEIAGDGRRFYSQGQPWIDFCSCNYLGFDREPLMHEMGSAYSQAWGPISGWSRLEAQFAIYEELEERLAHFLGTKKIHLGHSITSMSFSIIPNIAKKGVIFTDHKVHTVVWEACRLARDHGATIVRWEHQDLDKLEQALRAHTHLSPKLIAVDGVYSITTELAPIKELQALCRRYDAWLYVDDAHGFGILGQGPSDANPFGVSGSGIVRHTGGDYERTFYVSSFGKAFCTMMSFVAIPAAYPENVPVHAMTNIFSSPLSPYNVGTVMAALSLNETKGEAARASIRKNVSYFVTQLRELGFKTDNILYQPIFFVEIGTFDELMTVATTCKDRGILAGLRPSPVVPADQCGLRFAVHSNHSREQIDEALNVMADIKTGQRRRGRQPA